MIGGTQARCALAITGMHGSGNSTLKGVPAPSFAAGLLSAHAKLFRPSALIRLPSVEPPASLRRRLYHYKRIDTISPLKRILNNVPFRRAKGSSGLRLPPPG